MDNSRDFMSRQWFEERKEILIRELAAGFVEAFVNFEELYQDYGDQGKLQHASWEGWIGSESRKGPLWRLVDLSHSIFRRSGARLTMHEALLDWSLGALFHECLKIREDAYQLGHPLQWNEGAHVPQLPEIRSAIEDWERHLAQIRVSIRAGLEEVHQLFQSAWRGLKGTLITYRDMGLLMRYLAENRNLFVDLLGEQEWCEFMDELHPNGEGDTWYLAGMSYDRSGWYDRAKIAFERSLAICPDHPKAAEMRTLLEG
jgi:tetratricopeptide (TPR) repeat protein